MKLKYLVNVNIGFVPIPQVPDQRAVQAALFHLE